MERTLLAALSGVLTLAACVSGDDPPDRNAGDDARRAATEAVFADFVGDGPGCSIAVRHDGTVDDWQFGVANIARADPITPDTIFDIGSVSKQITGGVIAAMSLNGSLALDTPVTDFFDRLPEGSDNVTVSDLVHHASGLPDYVDLIDAELDEATDADDAFDAIAGARELNFDPRNEFEYSNTNYFLLAELAGQVADDGFPTLTNELIFTPLEMSRSVVRNDQGQLLDGQATGYEAFDDGWRSVSSGWQQAGDGAVHSTPLDLIRWADTFIEPGQSGATAGSAEWVELMVSSGPVEDEDGADYGFGVSVGADGDAVWHGGSWLGYSSYLGIRRSAASAVAVSCNIDQLDAEGLGVEVLDIWS